MIGGFISLPKTFLGGLIVGVVEAVILANTPETPGVATAVFFVLVLGLLLTRKLNTEGINDSDGAILRMRPLPPALQDIWWLRRMPLIGYSVVVALAILAPAVVTGVGERFTLTLLVIYPVICLSLTVLSGWAGVISLGQWAFVGIGAFIAGGLTLRAVPFPAAVVFATLLTAVIAAISGLPALRLKGLFVAISTLALAVAAHQWLFELPWVRGSIELPQLVRTPWLEDGLAYYYFCLAWVVAAFIVVTLLQRSGSARLMLATRDNENAVNAFGVDPRKVKITTFAFAGGLAGLGGALLGGNYVRFGAEDFGPTLSLTLVATLIVGGIGMVSGSVLGPLWVIGLPLLFGGNPTVALAASGVGLLVFLLYVPQGLASFPLSFRDYVVRRLLERRTAEEMAPPSPASRPGTRTEPVVDRAPAPAGEMPSSSSPTSARSSVAGSLWRTSPSRSGETRS